MISNGFRKVLQCFAACILHMWRFCDWTATKSLVSHNTWPRHAKKKTRFAHLLTGIHCVGLHLLVLWLTRPTFARIELRVHVTPSQSSNFLIIKHWMKDQRNSKMLFIDSFLHSKTPRQNPERCDPFFFRPTISSLTSNLGQKVCSNLHGCSIFQDSEVFHGGLTETLKSF